MSHTQLTKPSPQLSRRFFLGAGAASLLCGLLPLGHPHRLAGSVEASGAWLTFRQGRARPGHRVDLDVRTAEPLRGAVLVALAHRAPTGLVEPMAVLEVPMCDGVGHAVVDVPMRALLGEEKSRESFELVALLLTQHADVTLASDPLEVVVSPFPFGL